MVLPMRQSYQWGFPTIADTPIPEVLPTGICTYEHVVSNIPHDQIVQKAVEVRGLKLPSLKCPSGFLRPASRGKGCEAKTFTWSAGRKNPRGRVGHFQEHDEVEDGKVEVIGPDVDQIKPPAQLPSLSLPKWPDGRCRRTSNLSWSDRSTI